ncbi:hypothetical protein QJS04_geneDACA007104 [Acorus gramineus]|uniref:Uncharacterized protein n=1 Tax=Acorus gramineus TaxID=55184 RepID=A0AAV9BNB8_ACOGR|nr:hypothetical protein QJS04_geneDACA007104 [Acorus gramineus]
MEFLINRPADVKVLRDAKIFTVLMCDERGVAQVFSRMCREVWYSNGNDRLLVAYGKVNRYCDLRRNRWRAMLVRNYFNSPWSFISVMVAVVLLILTLLQTFYTMFGYYHPPSA